MDTRPEQQQRHAQCAVRGARRETKIEPRHFSELFAYAWSDAGQAERSLRLKQQALEARHKRWIGRGVVRSLETGTTFTLSESMLDMLDALLPDQDGHAVAANSERAPRNVDA